MSKKSQNIPAKPKEKEELRRELLRLILKNESQRRGLTKAPNQ